MGKKMATLNVCSCLNAPETKRFQVTVKDLDQIVKVLSEEISKALESPEDSFDLIYAGHRLKPSDVLSKVSIHNLSTIYVVKNFHKAKSTQKDGAVSGPSKSEVTMAMQSALLNLQYRNIVERMLCDPESVENIIATTPGLDRDPAVLTMLQEPELVAVLAHPQNMDSLLQLHPSFSQAAVTMATAVNEESSQSITASQLAAALQAATGGAGVSSGGADMSAPGSSGTSQPGASGSATAITTDFFQQAMAHAQSASSDAGIQQLREMGITDENVARQALAATGGDIQAAIDLIFGDGIM